MKKFIVSSTYKVLKDGTTEITFKPSDELIDNYVASYKIYNTLAEGIADIDNSIIEITPVLFSHFQQMDNIPQVLKDQFEL
jgi:hypothetical protein